jgi:hypothetical protein
MDLTRDIDSLTHFKRNTTAVIEQLRATGQAMVLTVNGKAEIVVQDAASYQRMLDLIDHAEAVVGIKKGLESMAREEGIPAEEAFERLRRKHNIPPEA